ncbi:hypothetical protein A2U94_19115 [Bacillus sp. VT 712]|uniref:Spore coat protein n=1 Tax=Priestia veravalensis TaxID=1414648 RepID=A0A0V8JLE6_9BACI|nr:MULTISPECIES: YppG family protein [Bacillaceae]KSU87867.1 hypothetical protein AS180_10670 [Priestia veravalensis]KZB89891.1 hypothetical protein A2U94_19115 [Bacillus sp. VT 712]SCC26657.1 YppG-like protein [Priestia flexa]
MYNQQNPYPYYMQNQWEEERFDLSQVYPFPEYHQQPWHHTELPQQPYAQVPPQMQYVNNQQQYPFYQNGMPFPNPYPKGNQQMKQQPNQFHSLMSQFKSSDGNYDVNKMMNTAGQMMGAMNQLTNLVKGFTGIFKI